MMSCSVLFRHFILALPLCIYLLNNVTNANTSCPSADAVLNDIRINPKGVKINTAAELAVLDFDNACYAGEASQEPQSQSPGERAHTFLQGLANSQTFREQYWHKKPLLIRSESTGGWVAGAFTIERDLVMVENSYISGHKTGDVLRNGTKTDTWAFEPIKADPSKKSTWSEVEDAMKSGTIYFNTAGSLWPVLGALCRLTMESFGLPSNVNVYITPAGITVSVPPHTDKQDVIVMQTAGAKRWRVFAPPIRSKLTDPLNRGKAGDVLSFDEMGEPLIDTVVNKGDILYVPAGFPHTTDTCTVVDVNGASKEQLFDETSVHMTMGLDTHVWALTFAHLRWSLVGLTCVPLFYN